jgi:hypothetical protein
MSREKKGFKGPRVRGVKVKNLINPRRIMLNICRHITKKVYCQEDYFPPISLNP